MERIRQININLTSFTRSRLLQPYHVSASTAYHIPCNADKLNRQYAICVTFSWHRREKSRELVANSFIDAIISHIVCYADIPYILAFLHFNLSVPERLRILLTYALAPSVVAHRRHRVLLSFKIVLRNRIPTEWQRSLLALSLPLCLSLTHSHTHLSADFYWLPSLDQHTYSELFTKYVPAKSGQCLCCYIQIPDAMRLRKNTSSIIHDAKSGKWQIEEMEF